jgi:hypothetical protein
MKHGSYTGALHKKLKRTNTIDRRPIHEIAKNLSSKKQATN